MVYEFRDLFPVFHASSSHPAVPVFPPVHDPKQPSTSRPRTFSVVSNVSSELECHGYPGIPGPVGGTAATFSVTPVLDSVFPDSPRPLSPMEEPRIPKVDDGYTKLAPVQFQSSSLSSPARAMTALIGALQVSGGGYEIYSKCITKLKHFGISRTLTTNLEYYESFSRLPEYPLTYMFLNTLMFNKFKFK